MGNRRRQAQFDEPSLVPLADMLTNVVGIMVFIMIFTVLAVEGAMIVKHLPVERTAAEKKASVFVCENDRVYPLSQKTIADLASLPAPSAIDGAWIEWGKAMKDRKPVSDGFVTLEVRGEPVREDAGSVKRELTIACSPVAKAGWDAAAVSAPGGAFEKAVAQIKAEDGYAVFWVRPDSISAFTHARNAVRNAGCEANWVPQGAKGPILFRFGGEGRIQ